jgi:CDGSH iron-sulfur domain-containing protein 3
MSNPKIVELKSKCLNMEPGDYYWCACGESKNQPFCDGSHKGGEFSPIPVKIDEKKDIYWCMCKHSGTKPFCDGTHRNL